MNALSLALALAVAQASPASKPTPSDAKAFVAKVNDELKRLWIRQSTADWIK